MKELKDAVNVLKSCEFLSIDADVFDAIKVVLPTLKKLLAVEGSGILPEKRSRGMSCNQNDEEDDAPCYQNVYGFNAAIDETALRLTKLGEGLLPEKKEYPIKKGINYYKTLNYATGFNACREEMRLNLAKGLVNEKDVKTTLCSACKDCIEPEKQDCAMLNNQTKAILDLINKKVGI